MRSGRDPGTRDQAHGALLENDLLSAPTLLDDATLLHMPGTTGLAGDYQGRGPILSLYAHMADLTDDTLRFVPSRVLADTDRVIVVIGTEIASRRDRRLETEAIRIYALRDAVVREIWVCHDDQGRVDAFWKA